MWESHTNKQGVIDPSIKMQRLRFLTNCLSNALSHMRIIIKKLDGTNFTNQPSYPHFIGNPWHGQNTEIIYNYGLFWDNCPIIIFFFRMRHGPTRPLPYFSRIFFHFFYFAKPLTSYRNIIKSKMFLVTCQH